jgi:tetratricopeptide (TPR) repeat protein
MSRYSKIFLSVLLASAAALFICGITTGPAFAAFQDEADEEDVGYTEEEYEEWDAADKEADILKSGAMLIEFMKKNPQSELAPYAEGSYMRLLNKCVEEKRYQELETLAEQWNNFKPGNDSIVPMIAVAARELKHTEKYLWAMEEMYKKTPQLDYAKEIRGLYKNMKNDAKWVEWTQTVMNSPEEASNFLLHYELFEHFTEKNDTAKISEYTQSTLKAIDQTKNPSAEQAKIIPDIRHALNHNTGVSHYTAKRYDDAITYFMRALRDRKYSNGYYLIGRSLWEQKKILNARMAFAKAQLHGETAQASAEDKTIAPRAKEMMEQIHRSLQNNTLVGIERQYNRAREMSDEDLLKPME